MRGKKPKERKNYILRTENGTLVEVTRGGLSGMVSVPEKGKIPAGTETEIRCLQS